MRGRDGTAGCQSEAGVAPASSRSVAKMLTVDTKPR